MAYIKPKGPKSGLPKFGVRAGTRGKRTEVRAAELRARAGVGDGKVKMPVEEAALLWAGSEGRKYISGRSQPREKPESTASNLRS